MTSNQIAYWNYKELIRHNQAEEAERFRHQYQEEMNAAESNRIAAFQASTARINALTAQSNLSLAEKQYELDKRKQELAEKTYGSQYGAGGTEQTKATGTLLRGLGVGSLIGAGLKGGGLGAAASGIGAAIATYAIPAALVVGGIATAAQWAHDSDEFKNYANKAAQETDHNIHVKYRRSVLGKGEIAPN